MKNRKELKKKKRIKLRNKKLIKQYPWLLPRNVWTGKVLDNFDYSWHELDGLPDGWLKAFGKFLIKDMGELLKKAHFEREYRIVQTKEKFGRACIYDNGVPKSIYEDFRHVIHTYETISENVCACCGRTDVFMTYSGWDYPLCKHCYETHINDTRPYEEVISDKDTGKMADSYTIRRFGTEGNEDTTYDIHETAEKIRRAYARKTRRSRR